MPTDFQPCAICTSLKHHCISATSVNVKLVFSADVYIVRRSKLIDLVMELLELLVGLIAKCNNDMVMGISG